MSSHPLSPTERLALNLESLLMTRMVPLDHPGPVFRWFFKIPILFYRAGIPLFNDFILLLTTTGRKSGKLRFTPLEYRRDPGTDCVIITAGWGGHTDWQYNIQANPRVGLQIGRRKYVALAERLSDVQVAAWMADAIRLNPRSALIFSRWTGERVAIDAPESLLHAAPHFPSFRLKPVNSALQGHP